ncbi:MAG TPA: hypothetical protein VLT47_08880 [Anaeromyxobacteraceae bacterium]|nr:hypothetical protein [Anaeromyxobacteraceae bacterium]
MTERRPDPGADEAPPESHPEPTLERTPTWPRRAAQVAVDAAWKDLTDTGRHLLDTGRWKLRGAWSRRPSPAGLAAWGFLIAAALLGAATLLLQTGLAARLPTALDWRAATALLERDYRPGDAVVVSPAWAERARAELPARVPVFALPRYADEPLVGVRRVWVLSLPGVPFARDRIARDIAARASTDGGTQRIGAMAVTRYDLAQPTRAIAWLPDWLASARAKVGDRLCAHDGPRAIVCPGTPVPIAREVREVAGAPRPCLSAQPGSAASGPVSITFTGVPFGLELRGAAGVVGAIPSPGAPPIRFAVQVDGSEVAGLELPGGAPVRRTFAVRTAAMAEEPHTVTVVLSSPDPAGRTVCFDAWTLP